MTRKLGMPLTKATVASTVQCFVKQHYARPLPAREAVTVPFRGNWVKWDSLNKDEKIRSEQRACPPSQSIAKQFVGENASRQHVANGCRPAKVPGERSASWTWMRPTLSAPPFMLVSSATLYNKYHPKAELSREESLSPLKLPLPDTIQAGKQKGQTFLTISARRKYCQNVGADWNHRSRYSSDL